MRKVFLIEWPEKLGSEWLHTDNLRSCLFSGNFITRQNIKVEDISVKAEKAFSIGKPPHDVEEYYKEVGMTKAFLVEWLDGVPEHVNAPLVRACLFSETHMDEKEIKIRAVAYPEEIDLVPEASIPEDEPGPSEFNKMASTKYIHVGNVVHMLREVVEEVSYVGNRGRVLEMVNKFLESKGINERLAVDWKIVVVPVEVSTIAKEEDDD